MRWVDIIFQLALSLSLLMFIFLSVGLCLESGYYFGRFRIITHNMLHFPRGDLACPEGEVRTCKNMVPAEQAAQVLLV